MRAGGIDVAEATEIQGQAFGWGLIGASTIGREYVVPSIHKHERSKIVGVYSADPDRGMRFAEAENAGRSYASLDDLLGDDHVDGVYVSTTNELHSYQVIRAAQAGKHILCEKPLALDLDEAQAMVAACRAAGVVLGTNHHIRNAGSIRLVRDLVQNGRIGRPIAARVFHAGYLPERLQGWRLSRPDGGGVIVDVTVHDADTLRFVLQDEPQDVVAQRQEGGMATGGVEDGAMAVIRFRSGLIAQLHDSFTLPFARTGLEIHGTKGSILATDVLTQRPVGRVVVRDRDGETEPDFDREDLYLRQIRSFVAAVHGGPPPSCTGDDGVRSLAVALAVREAALTGVRTKVP